MLFLAGLLLSIGLGATKEFHTDLIRTTWGATAFDSPVNWAGWFAELASGHPAYAGIEAPTWVVCGVAAFSNFGVEHGCNETRAALFRDALAQTGLYFVAQVHTCGYPISSADVDDHLRSLEALSAVAVALGATLLNVHGGVDFWTDAENAAFFEGALAIERALGVPMAHETHRMRVLASPRTAAVALDSFPGISLTADLSHWVLSAERLFNFPSDDRWWPKLLERVANATVLTHARLGSPREIQVADPEAPEHAALLEAYERWWTQIWANQAKRTGLVRIEAEFGPAPYMPTLPRSNWPLADLERAVTFIGHRQIDRIRKGQLECWA